TAGAGRGGEVSKLSDRCRRALISLGWEHPAFLPPSSLARYVEDRSVPQMAAGADGTIHVNPDWAALLDDRTLAGGIAHELMHLMLFHHHRGHGLSDRRWLIVTDMAINARLRDAGIQLPPGCVFPPNGREGDSAEQLYRDPGVQDPGEQGFGCGCEHPGG